MMAQNLFEELQEKKQRLMMTVTKAKEFGWIDSAREQAFINKLNNDTLTIGVIGQMKCGKSTFLNAFVFEDDVLPSATTPMTAALSVITYGAEKRIVAEFYNHDEWAEQKMQAARSMEEVAGNTLEESKVKAAKELVEKAVKLGSSLDSYLGQTKSDTFEHLIEYVGADGKYVSITKSVTIYYPKEYLKGVEIVDTPGFNDPIVSREERTKEFLKKADVVLLMLYAGRPFDATDRDILFKNVGQCGTGRVLIGINKYDIPYEHGEMESEIKDYVKEQLRRACKECKDNLMNEILQQTEPIPLSAEMALLSELPMSKVLGTDAYNFAWNRACDNFEISSQHQMREKSHIDLLIAAVKKVVEKEKEVILFRKPMNAIVAAGNTIKNETEKDLQACQILIQNLNLPDDELEEKQEKLQKAERRLNKKIDGLGDDIDSTLNDIVRRGRNQLEDDVDSACKELDRIIDELGRFSSPDSIKEKLNTVQQKLVTKTLRDHVEEIGNKAKINIKSAVYDFTTEVEDILMRYVEDFDSQDFVKKLGKELNLDIEDNDMFSFDNGNDDDYGWGNLVYDILNSATWGVLGGVNNFLNHGDYKNKMHEAVNEMRNVDMTEYLNHIFKRKDEIIDKVRNRIIDQLVSPLQKDIESIQQKGIEKANQAKEAEDRLETLKNRKVEIDSQIQQIIG